MFRALTEWFKTENLLIQAKKQILEMLQIVDKLFLDSVNLFWMGEGITIEEIRKQDKQINRLVRDVRKKVLTHLAFSGSSGLETSLVMVNIVVFIERIGDYTKDIGYLATDYPGKCEAGELEQEFHELENTIEQRLGELTDLFSEGEEESREATELTRTHQRIDEDYRELLSRLMDEENNVLSPGTSAKLTLYLRYLRRVEGHIFNIASAEANPFHRISFPAKKKRMS